MTAGAARCAHRPTGGKTRRRRTRPAAWLPALATVRGLPLGWRNASGASRHVEFAGVRMRHRPHVDGRGPRLMSNLGLQPATISVRPRGGDYSAATAVARRGARGAGRGCGRRGAGGGAGRGRGGAGAGVRRSRGGAGGRAGTAEEEQGAVAAGAGAGAGAGRGRGRGGARGAGRGRGGAGAVNCPRQAARRPWHRVRCSRRLGQDVDGGASPASTAATEAPSSKAKGSRPGRRSFFDEAENRHGADDIALAAAVGSREFLFARDAKGAPRRERRQLHELVGSKCADNMAKGLGSYRMPWSPWGGGASPAQQGWSQGERQGGGCGADARDGRIRRRVPARGGRAPNGLYRRPVRCTATTPCRTAAAAHQRRGEVGGR